MATTNRLDPAAARAIAQKLYEERMAAVEHAVEAANRVRELTEQLANAQRSAARAYADAERAGWTPDDLKRIGLETPSRRVPGRPPRRPAAQHGNASRPEAPTAA